MPRRIARMHPDWSESRVRVRYCETDAMGIAHHAEYLAWYEVARTDWIRRGSTPADERSYRRMERAGWFLPVVEASSRHHASARYDDELVVAARVLEATRARIAFEYVVRRADDGRVLAEGRTVHAYADRQGRARRLPQGLLDWLVGTGPFPEDG